METKQDQDTALRVFPDKLKEDPFEDFDIRLLDNGLELYAKKKEEAVRQTIFFQIWAGHYQGQRGIAHFTEHMLADSAEESEFKTPITPFLCEGMGVKKLKEISEVGGNLISGGAFVALFHSGYGGALPANPSNMESFLELFHRYLLRPEWRYPVDKARSVLKAERREHEGGNNSVCMRKHRLDSVWQGHWCQDVLVNHGSEEDIDSMTRGTAEEFCRRYYVPANITVYSQGPMDIQEIESLLVKTGWVGAATGERVKLSLSEYNIKKPLLLGFCYHNPVNKSGAFYSQALVPMNYTTLEKNFSVRLLRKYLNDSFRREMGLVYGVSVSGGNTIDCYDISISLDGVSVGDVDKVYDLYRKKMTELIEGGPQIKKLFDESLRTAVEGFCHSNMEAEGVLREIAARRVYDGCLITDRELITLYSKIHLDRVLSFLSYIHPSKAYHRWGLPTGWTGPSGMPINEILLT